MAIDKIGYFRMVLSKKRHKCSRCSGIIQKGESYYRRDEWLPHGVLAVWADKICMNCANEVIEA